MTRSETDAPARSLVPRVVLVGAVVPIAIAVAAVMLMHSWIPELPEQIGVHWTGSGPDRFEGPIPFIFLPLFITVPYSVLVIVMGFVSARAGGLMWAHKLLIASNVWLSTLMAVSIGGSVHMQRGLVDARDAGGVELWILTGLAVSLVACAVAWFVLPKATMPDPRLHPVEPLPREDNERVSWTRTVRAGTAVTVIAALAVVSGLVAVIVMLWEQPSNAWLPVGVVALLAVLVAAMSRWRVSADRRGFTVRSVLGWPRVRIPLGQIDDVAVVQVDPTGEFGGWGWRWAPGGKSGLIMRAGEAIEVTRSNGKRLVVTVDDAATGAATLKSLVG